MLKIERDERTITVISDDKRAENAILQDAVEHVAPELLGAFNDAPVVNGELRWEVDQKDWLSLLEAIDVLGHDDNMDPAVAVEIYDEIETACREAGLFDRAG
jgi:hypothetical protein